MSFFLVYFETKNAESTDFKGFADVGRFQLPEVICAGDIDVTLSGAKHRGQLVSDRSKQSANDLFYQRAHPARVSLLDFIASRLSNQCVHGNLIGHIETNGRTTLTVRDMEVISFQKLAETFNRAQFLDGCGLRIVDNK